MEVLTARQRSIRLGPCLLQVLCVTLTLALEICNGHLQVDIWAREERFELFLSLVGKGFVPEAVVQLDPKFDAHILPSG